MIRLKREQYAVAAVSFDGLEITVGIWHEPGELDVQELARYAKDIAGYALTYGRGSHQTVVDLVQGVIDAEMPGVPFYVETGQNGWGVQVYQPYGMPRENPTDSIPP